MQWKDIDVNRTFTWPFACIAALSMPLPAALAADATSQPASTQPAETTLPATVEAF